MSRAGYIAFCASSIAYILYECSQSKAAAAKKVDSKKKCLTFKPKNPVAYESNIQEVINMMNDDNFQANLREQIRQDLEENPIDKTWS